ncbi:MAG: folylpolyglutamate synthase/dihydrofolate synthase family protein [Rikenellaceae bacterium]
MNYSETLNYLFTAMPSFQNIGGDAYKPGLERIMQFCARLGDPHLKYKVIHIAGTNGKGSTSHALASVLQHAGYRTALFTSPHLRDFRERIRVNGSMVSEQEVIEFVERYRPDMEELRLSFFEMTAAMAFRHFALQGVDIAVIETGLGGRLDATNIVSPILSIITNIGIDHTKFLGSRLPQIAAEKGGIIKDNRAVILGERSEEYTYVIEEIARLKGAELLFAEDKVEVISQEYNTDGQLFTLRDMSNAETLDIELDMGGSYQAKNIVTAYAAIKYLDGSGEVKIPQSAITSGFRSVVSTTSLMGRWQKLNDLPLMICDTGHNAHGLKYVMEQLRATPHKKLIMVLGFANDKKLDEILPLFDPKAHFIFTRPKVDRAFPCEEIMGVAKSLGLDCEAVDDVQEAILHAKNIASRKDLIFVGGSNFVVAEVY